MMKVLDNSFILKLFPLRLSVTVYVSPEKHFYIWDDGGADGRAGWLFKSQLWHLQTVFLSLGKTLHPLSGGGQKDRWRKLVVLLQSVYPILPLYGVWSERIKTTLQYFEKLAIQVHYYYIFLWYLDTHSAELFLRDLQTSCGSH